MVGDELARSSPDHIGYAVRATRGRLARPVVAAACDGGSDRVGAASPAVALEAHCPWHAHGRPGRSRAAHGGTGGPDLVGEPDRAVAAVVHQDHPLHDGTPEQRLVRLIPRFQPYAEKAAVLNRS